MVLFCDELSAMPAFDILPLFSTGRSRKLALLEVHENGIVTAEEIRTPSAAIL